MAPNSLPADFEARIKEIIPQGTASFFEPRRYQSFRINTLKIAVKEALALLDERKIGYQGAEGQYQ